jgi:hypothetical protein
MDQVIRYVVVWTALLGEVLFFFSYLIFNRRTWWRTEMGLNLMSFSFMVLITLVSSVLTLTLGPNYPGAIPVRFAIEFMIVGVTWWRTLLYWRTRFRRRRDSA